MFDVKRSLTLTVIALFLIILSGTGQIVIAQLAPKNNAKEELNTPRPKLAVLVSAAWSADTSMHNDLVAMHQALQKRGFQPDEIFSLEGKLNRNLVLNFLSEIAKTTKTWREGEIFLFYTGHGSLEGDTPKDARVGLMLSPKEKVWWNEVFAALPLAPKVKLILLSDS